MKIPNEIWIVHCELNGSEWLMPPIDSDVSFMAFDSKVGAEQAIVSQKHKWPDAFGDATMTPVQIKQEATTHA